MINTINTTAKKFSLRKTIVNLFTSKGLSAQEQNCYAIDAAATI